MEPTIESLTRRVEKLERSTRLMKITGGITLAVVLYAAQLPILSASSPPHAAVNTTHLNLVTGSGQVLASLGGNPNGGASLTFYDNSGKREALVGESLDAQSEGLQVFDGNSIRSGTGIVRGGFGGGLGDGGFSEGFGEAIVDSVGKPRYSDGLDTASGLSGAILFDANGSVRGGIDVDLANNFTGLFTQNGSGVNMSVVGNSLDNSASFLLALQVRPARNRR